MPQPPRVTTRAATLDDHPEIARLYLELKRHHKQLAPGLPRYNVDDGVWELRARATLADPEVAVLVAEGEPGIVGFVECRLLERFWGTACVVETLVVEEGSRGAGIGTLLMAEAEGFARRSGARAMRVDVLPGNERGRSFYERAGYGPVAIRLGKDLPVAQAADPSRPRSWPEAASPPG